MGGGERSERGNTVSRSGVGKALGPAGSPPNPASETVAHFKQEQPLPPAGPAAADSGPGETQHRWKSRIRLPVGVALGLVFSVLLVAVCGIIVGSLAAADRQIAMRLLSQQALSVLKHNETVLNGFFARQEQLFRSLAARTARPGVFLSDADLKPVLELLPEGVQLELGRTVMEEVPGDMLPRPAWSGFEYRKGFQTAVRVLEIDLGNGQRLSGYYPQLVFARLAQEMALDGAQSAFLLEGKNKAIAVAAVPLGRFAATPEAALPDLTALTETPLHLLWRDMGGAHRMEGVVDGRLFPADGRMYTAIFTQIEAGPAKGWIAGALYKAKDFGAVLDQTWFVLYAALATLVVGAFLSFMVGRLLGRPLTRLAEAAAGLRRLDFDTAGHLPRSRLAELDDVNQAFNGSTGALNAFARYVPRQLVSRLIEEGMTDSRTVELREMTIVFADLAGFTGKASHLSAEETATYLNGYFETVSNVIADGEGTIDKFLGDGVMAFWGAPSDQPDHAAMAIRAVKELAQRIGQSRQIDLRVRIGVHTGKVVVGDIGTAARMNYTVIGDAVNVAARLQEHGKSVDPEAKVIALASAETIAQMPEGLEAVSLGPVQLRGREEALSIFRIA